MVTATVLKKKISEITANTADEADLYAYVRDLLTRRTYGIELDVAQVVIDSRSDESRRRPDIAIYRTLGGRALRGPDYVTAVFEVKTDDQVARDLKNIVRQKRPYVQPGTYWFFLLDQTVVTRIDVRDRSLFDAAMKAPKALSAEIATTWTWQELEEPTTFEACFGVISRENLKLEGELAAFKSGRTPYAFLQATGDGRSLFAETIREASELIRAAVRTVVETRGVEDLKAANLALEPMRTDYGDPLFNWSNINRPIEFANMASTKLAAMLSDELVLAYQSRLDELMIEIAPFLYALRLETDLLQQYAARQGLEGASLLRLESDEAKPNKRLLQSLVYETGSLILSRMLMIRFSEDYELFSRRYISNGGVEVFWNYAAHFDRPMQALLRETYRLSRTVFRSIFDPSLLDWAIERDDPVLSEALTRAAFVLSRWNFTTVRGDILSGVYDKYLDVSQRRRLGEVYTRPEIARFMLKAANWQPADRVLDPACGTGTFLVEALVSRLDALAAAGAINDVTVQRVIGNLHGLDISPFSIALAQIQVFWHLVELMKDKSAEEARQFARAILPALRLYGGWSSLDTMGRSFDSEHDATRQSGLAFRVGHAGQDRVKALVPSGFERTANSEFDLVVMNPPYIRSERQGSVNYRTLYGEVAFRGTDTSIFFIYRALKHWVRPGGRLAFIVPIGVLEADYAGPLRKLLAQYRITTIADLEGLGKVTFRGVKRATVIVIVEKVPASPEDDVAMLQLDPSAVIDDVIDFDRAARSIVKRHQLDRLAYVPRALRGAAEADELPEGLPADSAEAPVWLQALRVNENGADAVLTKLTASDVPALESLKELPRLGDIISIAWTKRIQGRIAEVSKTRPAAESYRFTPELLFNYGVKLGGRGALDTTQANDAINLFKGQNIFPQGLVGAPLGRWSPSGGRETTRYIYSYADQLTYESTFALRELSQLPTAAPVKRGQGFQNTAFILELDEPFPLHSYLLSRIVQFYCARVLRSSIIEDLGCHWYKRTVPYLPIPANRTPVTLDALRQAGQAVLDADSDVADRYREIDALKAAGIAGAATVNQLIVDGHPLAQGLDLNGASETALAVFAINEVGSDVLTSDLLFRLTVPNNDLRSFIAFELGRRVEEDPEGFLSRDDVLQLTVPGNLADVLVAIRAVSSGDLSLRYRESLLALDHLVAEQCGIPPELRDYMITAMVSDPILSKMRPMLAQRGMRVQNYADHSDGDRYD